MGNVQVLCMLFMYPYSLPALVLFTSLNVPDSSCRRAPLYDVGVLSSLFFFQFGENVNHVTFESLYVSK